MVDHFMRIHRSHIFLIHDIFLLQMWSIDYIAETAEEQTESIEGVSVDPVSSSIDDKEKDTQKLSIQDSEEVKSEAEVKVETEVKTEEAETQDREAAIKRVEELVKQMSLSQENEGMFARYGKMVQNTVTKIKFSIIGYEKWFSVSVTKIFIKRKLQLSANVRFLTPLFSKKYS